MLEILGTSITKKKSSVWLALTEIYGVGKPTAKKICKNLGILNNQKVKDLNAQHLISINDFFVNFKGLLNENLKKKVIADKKKLIDIKSYRGMRLAKGYPARGQRTHSNAKTPRKKL